MSHSIENFVRVLCVFFQLPKGEMPILLNKDNDLGRTNGKIKIKIYNDLLKSGILMIKS